MVFNKTKKEIQRITGKVITPMRTPPTVIPVHTAVPGQARFRIGGLARIPTLKSDLETHFPRLPYIRSASASFGTGNLLIH
jgi:hypothetical protein